MGTQSEGITAAERKLLNAIATQSPCDFLDCEEAQTDNSTWGDDRHIRATFLRQVLEGNAEDWVSERSPTDCKSKAPLSPESSCSMGPSYRRSA